MLAWDATRGHVVVSWCEAGHTFAVLPATGAVARQARRFRGATRHGQLRESGWRLQQLRLGERAGSWGAVGKLAQRKEELEERGK